MQEIKINNVKNQYRKNKNEKWAALQKKGCPKFVY
jgi:hypothetical protein